MSSNLSVTTLVVGIIVLIGFAALCFHMISVSGSLKADEQHKWDHSVVIFNSIQAMAAAALGVLLGTTVQQARVDAANAKATLAEKKRRENEKDGLKNEAIRGLLSDSQALEPQALKREAAEPAATVSAVRKILEC